MDRGHLPTEQPNPRTSQLDSLSTLEAVEAVNAEDATVAAAVHAARHAIARAVDLVAERLASGGRLFYVGAGTSGRLGVLDAAECPPTFRSDPELVQGVIAGGERALTRAIEGAEDSAEAARTDLLERGLGEKDVVFGIAAGGTTPYVHGALAHAREHGAATVFFACVAESAVSDEADVSIRVITGPEVLTGSTRMKAGTATKLVLNTVSTLVMTRLGKVFGNRMVDVETRGNAKLRDRGIRLVAELGEVERERAAELLDAADGSVKVAVVMARRGGDAAAARAWLDEADGRLRDALGGVDRPGPRRSEAT